MAPNALIHISRVQPRPFPKLTWQERLERLREDLRALGTVVVAYSGGVDSSVLLKVAHETLGANAHGVIGRSDSYASRELELALSQAAAFGAEVEIVTTGELADPNFSSNPADRCYHCKSELYRELGVAAGRFGATAILDGTISDDLEDYRPGRKAAGERGVESPLARLGFNKADVRAAAAALGLSSAEKPASPCLASRIPYGTTITRENLSMVERAEEALRLQGFRDLRVRHYGDEARIEVRTEDFPRLIEADVREAIVASLRGIGYARVTLDLEGFRSGSLNRDLGR